MALNRTAARNLLLPGFYQHTQRLGRDFTDAEIESCVDAYLAAPRGQEGVAFKERMDEIVTRVMTPEVAPEHKKRAAQLAVLKSVSPEFRRTHLVQKYFVCEEDIIDAYLAWGMRREDITPHHLATAYGGYLLTRTGGFNNGLASVHWVFLPPLEGDCPHANRTRHTPLACDAGKPTHPGSLAKRRAEDRARQGASKGTSQTTYEGTSLNGLPTSFKAQEIIAWRAWALSNHVTDRLGLYSLNNNWWNPDKPMRGDITHGLGVHAWKTRAQAEAYTNGGHHVFGQVRLWGEVIEHKDGYRAEYGAVHSLPLQAPKGRGGVIMPQLRTMYNVPPPPPPKPVVIAPPPPLVRVATPEETKQVIAKAMGKTYVRTFASDGTYINTERQSGWDDFWANPIAPIAVLVACVAAFSMFTAAVFGH